jgi:hypothetical protein
MNALGRAKPQGEFAPLAVIPQEHVDQLAESVAKMETPVIPSKEAGDSPLLKVLDTQDGTPVLKALHATPEGMSAREVTVSGKGPRTPRADDGTPIVLTPAAREAAEVNPNGQEAAVLRAQRQAKWEAEAPQRAAYLRAAESRGIEPDFNSDEAYKLWEAPKATNEIAPNMLDTMPEWDASLSQDIKHGAVVVMEQGDAAGTARIGPNKFKEGGQLKVYDLEDPALQFKILKQRGMVEAVGPDGQKVRGFYGSGDVLLAQDVSEQLPGVTKELVDVRGWELRPMRDSEIRDVLGQRARTMEEAANDAARLIADAKASAMDIQLGGNGDGSKLPPPPPMDPPPPPPGPPPEKTVDQLEELRLTHVQQMLVRLKQLALNPTSFESRSIADQAMAAHSIGVFERLRHDTFEKLTKSVRGLKNALAAQQRQFHLDVGRYVVGDIKDVAQLKALHPEVAQDVYDTLGKYKKAIRTNESQLKDLGMLDRNAKSVSDVVDEDYAVRVHYRYMMPDGEWARLFKKQKGEYESLVQEIKRDVYSTGAYLNESHDSRLLRAKRHADFLLGDRDVMKQLSKSAAQGKEDSLQTGWAASQKARRELTSWEKKALGTVDSGFARISETMTRQQQMLVVGHMWKSVADNPQLSSVGDDLATAAALGHTMRVPQSQQYGLAAGRLVSPDLMYALETAPRAQANAHTFISKAVGIMKFNQTVLNHASWYNQVLGNLQSIVLTNFYNPFASPYQVGRGFVTAWRDLSEHLGAPGLASTEGARRFNRGMELGMVGSSYSTTEFRRSASSLGRHIEKFSGGADSFNVLQWALEAGKSSKDFLASGYGAADHYFKYSAYVNGLAKHGVNLKTGRVKLEKALDFIGERYRPGMNEEAVREQVELEVARRVHLSMPMMDRVGEGVAQANKAGGVLVSPYLKIKSELIRNYAMIPQRIATEKGFAGNMMAWAAVVGGLVYTNKMLREQNGISQEEVDLAFDTAPQAVRRFKPASITSMYRSENGRLNSWDLTPLAEPLTWMQGDPNSSKLSNFLVNLGSATTNGSLLDRPMQEFLASSGMIEQPFQSKTPEYQRNGARLLGEALKNFGPGIIRNTYGTLSKGAVGFEPAAVRGPTVPPQGASTTAINLLLGPGRVTEVGGREQMTREVQRLAAEVRKAEIDLNQSHMLRQGQSTGMMTAPYDKQKGTEAARAILAEKVARLKALQERIRNSQGATK